MNRLTSLLGIVIAGLVFMFLLNTSPLARIGLSFELPFGWDNAQVERYHDCTKEEFMSDHNKNFCAGPCPASKRHNEGIPFAINRENGTDRCYSDTNNKAMLLNYITGAILGVAAIFIIERNQKKQGK